MISARSQAIQIAREMIRSNPVYLDTETTGHTTDSEIVEVCVLDDQGQVLFESLVKPTRPIPRDAIRIHGITDALVRGEPSWISVWPNLEKSLTDRLVGIYNAEFDLRLIRQTHAKYSIQSAYHAEFTPFCIMKLYAQYYGEWNRSRGSYRWISLEDAGRQCRIPLPNSHRARDDCLLARALLHYMAFNQSTV